MPKISIIMPVYNEIRYLENSIKSALEQSIGDIELICCDDGSNDGSLEYLKRIQKTESRLIVLQQNNQGAGPARNFCLEHATGEYICFLDADDKYVDSYALETMYMKMQEHKVSVCCGMLQYLIDGKVEDATIYRKYACKGDCINTYRDMQEDYYFQCFLFQKKLIDEHEIRFMDLRRYQDPPFLVSILHYAENILVIRNNIYLYRASNSKVSFDKVRTNDMLNGLKWELRFAKENNYDKLSGIVLNRIDSTFSRFIFDNLTEDNAEILQILLDMNSILGNQSLKLNLLKVMTRLLRECDYQWEKSKLDLEKAIGKEVVVYGAGERGTEFISKNIRYNTTNIVAWIDKKKFGQIVNDIEIKNPKSLNQLQYDYVIVAIKNDDIYEEICNELVEIGIKQEKIVRYK